MPRRSPSPALSPEAAASKPAFLPYGRQLIEDDDIAAVADVLRADMLTTGPMVEKFEQALAGLTGAADAIACSSGTAALYMATKALQLGESSAVIVPAITFAATASAAHLAGAEIVFADVDPETGLMRAEDLVAALRHCPDRHADAVFPVHYAGQSCDMAAIVNVARPRGMRIVEDAAHALGTCWAAPGNALVPIGANVHSDLTTFSFHPVKTIAMGEGGAVSTNDPDLARRLRRVRSHGIARSPAEFERHADAFDSEGLANPWYYEVEAPGFNWRVCDINCALAFSQLKKLSRFVETRQRIVAHYDALFASFSPWLKPLARDARSLTAWHLYPVRIDFAALKRERGAVMRALGAEGIGTQVHYIPLHRQPYYAKRYGAQSLPGAETYYAATLSIPLHAGMTESDAERVVESLTKTLGL